MQRAGAALAGELGKPFYQPVPGARIEGVYRRPVDLASGRFALIETSREFTLVPWRPDLERQLGRVPQFGHADRLNAPRIEDLLRGIEQLLTPVHPS